MQRERGALDSFPETIDLNQGSLPNSTSMDQSDPWDSMLNPVENRLPNYMLSSSVENVSCTNASNAPPSSSFSFWDHGESSSNTSAVQDGVGRDDSKTRLGLSGVRSEDWSFEPSSSISYSTRTLDPHNYSLNCGSLNASSSHGYFREHDDHKGIGAGMPLHKSGHPQLDPTATFYASSSNAGTSLASSSSFSEINDASGLPFSNWGTSCKRKDLEGTSEQFHPGGSSSFIRPTENVMQHPVPTCYPGSRNISISSGTLNLSSVNHLEHLHSSTRSGMNNMPLGSFPASGVPLVGESSSRNFSIRSNHGRHETVPFDTPRGSSVRRFGVNTVHSSRSMANTDLNELRSPMAPQLNPNNLNRPHLGHVNEARGMHSYPWDGSYSSRGGSSSGSFMNGERGSGAQEEGTLRSSGRNHMEYLMAVSAVETRNVLQGQIDWSFAPGSSSSRDHSSDRQIGLGSGGQPSLAGWLPHEIQTSPNHQQLSETAPWIPFPHAESEPGSRRRHFAILPSTSSSSDETASTRRAQHELRRSSAALLMDMQGDDINGWHSLAAVEGRHRLIRHVLSAMRRGVHLQAEDYMFIDPFINGIAEMHDRHRDMRLDVDNMSYEELLALEDRIGNVNTGLSEEKIMGFMKQRKHVAMGVSPNLEPCCICQENYVAGDDIGILDCGHEFHTLCIKQWLMLKNLCPICKTTALET